ncbi:hypothetical protein [Psychroserpens algicola]|uniref:Uncharacterized protein n=1 Tax=Psychroserpens algicola TaxID=1719034 RepID=A0ABT0HA14_9FLAO|nr:hypothetical protein [Psychroserpens algicola]MCK8481213.1 hypothetical protein [Psychroserpens algicola]
MKKLVPIILGFILGAIAMYFYFHNIKNEEDMSNTPTPKGIINPSQIQALTEAYNPRYDTISNKFFAGVKGGDNRSSWYSLEDLRNFLTIAEDSAKASGYTMTGVRLYLGAHPQVGDVPGYTTMLFVPTGYEHTAEGNMLNMYLQPTNHDLPGANGLDMGEDGDPPSSNYPQ